MVGVVGSSPIAPTKFHVTAAPCRRKARPHGKPRKRVYRYKRPGTDLAAACKVAASFKSEPRTAYVVRGFFLPEIRRRAPAGFPGGEFACRGHEPPSMPAPPRMRCVRIPVQRGVAGFSM